MGQQQLLLLVLAAVIVGVSVVVGINMFSQNALTSNIDAVKQDCLSIAARAQEWYRKPAVLGGGAHSFSGLTFEDLGYGSGLTTSYTNEHGTFTIDPTAGTSIDISGVTVETDGSGATWTVSYSTVTSTSMGTLAVTQTASGG
ncbi:hypothetical protein JXJ21_12310 [candidate division KSB1 bacterium]|nr:hypothetical protein [candidate division KSB1 bacterium]